jgi:ribosomal protein S18 acetylase RimI-like enzyme
MLRLYRAGDLPAYFDLMIGEFPQENSLLGWRREEFFRIVRRLDRLPIRLLLGLMSAVGRPLFRFWVLEVDGQLAASALETFSPPSAYVGSVVVAPRFRRRGFAKQVLERCHAAARRRGMRYVVLDVLDGNDGALALYTSLGYAPVGHGAHYARTVEDVGAPPPPSPRVRPFQKSDRRTLADIARTSVSEARQRVHPIDPDEFLVGPSVVRALDSKSESWVVDAGAGPVAWVRASASPAMAAAHLTAPVVAESANPEDVRAMIAAGIAWARGQGAPRVAVEAWDENVRGVAALLAAGFTPSFGVQTLAYSTGRG